MIPRLTVRDAKDIDILVLALHAYGNVHLAICDNPQHVLDVTDHIMGLVAALGDEYPSATSKDADDASACP